MLTNISKYLIYEMKQMLQLTLLVYYDTLLNETA